MIDANAAYTKEYLLRQNKYEKYFASNNYDKEICRQISSELSLITKLYSVDNTSSFVSINQLIDQNEAVIYEFKSFDASPFHELIRHLNGHNYFVYTRDLYGYSVFDLSGKKDFHYFPECFLKNEEAFILTSIHYNKLNNVLAGGGCFWGGRYDVSLIDFSNPMGMPENQILVSEHFDYQKEFIDVNYISWDGTDLHLEIECVSGGNDKMVISENEYLKWLSS